jgi:hypothetical protein
MTYVPTPYKELRWNQGFQVLNATVASQSPPSSAVLNPDERLLGRPMIFRVLPVEFFRFKSAYFSCFVLSPDQVLQPVSCTIEAIGYNTKNANVRKEFKYIPDGPKRFVLPGFFSDLINIEFTSLLLGTQEQGVIAMDSAEFTIFKPC